VNKVILVGNLGKDPEMKNFENGGSLVNLSLATSETYKNQQTGERETKTEWHRLVIRRPQLSEIAMKYLKKGMSIFIEGKLVTRSWMKDNVTQYITEIVVDDFTMLGSKAGSDHESQSSDQGNVSIEVEKEADLPF
ncbi:MAG: single-stranded DNA-binding protein, partial [Bacteroidota bacterium]